MGKKKSKKPFYKKWWFITIAVFLIVGFIGAELDGGDKMKDELRKIAMSTPVKTVTENSIGARIPRAF
ncbi:hypothetical protein FQ087_06345 [Sporosarcina sp. ANT_H38]|uniref:hypothetical protein n=1 Tax=Sporosarcina sp. ANT_H38 TaxID=2597358 RepID=UPI0011F20E42|nr:hypothetical protein [Sporosarcina sp. ANT_H38]KAA0965881.1 hypothetical protein FQ087_06345 [Sporosarcina sp. ANT_H38]